MNPISKKIAYGFLLFIGALLSIAIITAAFFEKSIGKRIIAEVNKSLKSPMLIKSFDLSLIKGFPNASVTLHEISLPDALDGTTLFEAKELSFRLNLMSIFGNKPQVKSVIIRNGAVYIRYDKNGNPNYDIAKPSNAKKPQKASSIALNLEKAILENVEVLYSDERTKQTAKLIVHDANLTGDFGSERFSLKSQADCTSEFLELSQGRYLIDKNIGYEATLVVDLKNGSYQLQEVQVFIESNVFETTGNIQQKEEELNYDIAFKGKNCTLHSLLELLPEEQYKYMSDFKSKGDFQFVGSVKGISSKTENPAIEVELTLENGQVSSPKLEEPLKKLSFAAFFNNGEQHNNAQSELAIKNLQATWDKLPISANLSIENLDNPSIHFETNGEISVNAIHKLFDDVRITGGSGKIALKDIQIKGNYKDLIDPNNIQRVLAEGQIVMDGATMTIQGKELSLPLGKLHLQGNTLRMQDLHLVGEGTDVTFNGECSNFLPVLFADSLNTQEAELTFQANLQAEKLDFNELSALATPSKNASNKNIPKDSLKIQQNQQREAFTKFLKGTFESNIKQFKYGKVEAKDFVGKLQFDKNKLNISGKTLAMGGAFDLRGDMTFEENSKLHARLICDNIDATAFFKQTDNFGQNVLTHEHIKGTLQANMLISAFWDQRGNFLYDKLHVFTDLTIANGTLNNFQMLEDFSAFVKIKDLQNIRFTKTRNWLEIRNQTVYIPSMFIQSNAMNMTLSGEHTFNQDLEYNVKVNAGQVLWNKFFKKASDKPIKAKNGWFNLYYRIYGNLSKYDFKSDKKAVENYFLKSEAQKQRIRKAMEAEFDNFKEIDELKSTEETDKPALETPTAPEAKTPAQTDDDGEVEYIDGY